MWSVTDADRLLTGFSVVQIDRLRVWYEPLLAQYKLKVVCGW